MMFQQYALFPHLSVRQNVMFGATTDIAPLLERFGSEPARGRSTRIALRRRATARRARPSPRAEPRLLLLDEPLAALDAHTRSAVRTSCARCSDVRTTGTRGHTRLRGRGIPRRPRRRRRRRTAQAARFAGRTRRSPRRCVRRLADRRESAAGRRPSRRAASPRCTSTPAVSSTRPMPSRGRPPPSSTRGTYTRPRGP